MLAFGSIQGAYTREGAQGRSPRFSRAGWPLCRDLRAISWIVQVRHGVSQAVLDTGVPVASMDAQVDFGYVLWPHLLRL